MQKKDNQLVVVTHLTQLLDYVTGFGGLIVPLILWLTKKDEILHMDEHGKSVLNFQLSLLLYTLISLPFILLFGLGLLGIFAVLIMGFVFPIVNAIKASNGQHPYYPLSISFLK